MEKKEAFRLAIQSLWANKLRSVLTLLGVVIAVASVIAVVTLVNGAKVFVATKINSQGADVFTISQQPAFITKYADYVKYQKRKIISLDEFRAVQRECTLCPQVGALQATTGKIKSGNASSDSSEIRGYTALMPEMQNLNIVEGRGYTQADEDHAAHVAIIGSDIEENVLKGDDPIGKEIRVDGVPYMVIGLGEKQGKTLGQSQDNWVGVPLTAFQKTYGSMKTLTIYAKAGTGSVALEAASGGGRQLYDFDERHASGTIVDGDWEYRWCGDCDCGDLAAGGRDCDYEHHAGERDGADAGDRCTQGAGGKEGGCADPVSDGVGDFVVDRRGAGCGDGDCGSEGCSVVCEFSGDDCDLECVCGVDCGVVGRDFLWGVSGEEGCGSGSDCGVEE
jgi:hypothetical protein